MKFSENWLGTWLDGEIGSERLIERLTLAGLEVDGVDELPAIEGVIAAEIVTAEPHPDADKLRVCEVNDGSGSLQIVCGAPNARAGLKVALATIGTRLPGGLKIRKSRIRGVESHGMLCSVAELGLGEEHDGILELPGDATPGAALGDVVTLPDRIIDVDLTPNRGDCFSLQGIAREVGTFGSLPVREPATNPVAPGVDTVHGVRIGAPAAAPVFATRVVSGIDATASSPLWMTERLRRSGIRAIHPVVDITNYVMLEFGQPLHAYDRARLSGDIGVRYAKPSERTTLLDEREVELESDVLVITDDTGPIGLAGIMGGASTAVTRDTRDVVFEAAFFAPDAIAGRARRFGLHTDASVRFERGVDPTGQARAIERATRLLLDIAGGDAGPVSVAVAEDHLPERKPVRLRPARLARILGTSIPDDEVTGIFDRLGMASVRDGEDWLVTAPGFRFDIEIEEDLIEEVARVYGYDRIPQAHAYAETRLPVVSEAQVPDRTLRLELVARGYHESISYSFVDPQRADTLLGVRNVQRLVNPISWDLSEMRTSLLPGLVEVARRNLSRQQSRVRVFEIGTVFEVDDENRTNERSMIAGLAAGPVLPEQWGQSAARKTDFFDIKSDVEALLATTGAQADFVFEPGSIAGLHPGQGAWLLRDGKPVGALGALHPAKVDLPAAGFVFEIDLEAAFAAKLPISTPISKFPAVRRDLALLVSESVTADEICDAARAAGGELLADVIIFDIYRGKGIEAGLKSVALGLILLDSSRTLTDQEADQTVAAVVAELNNKTGARLRE
jgi:phenylalanyl-tRNA synthetase beta chain